MSSRPKAVLTHRHTKNWNVLMQRLVQGVIRSKAFREFLACPIPGSKPTVHNEAGGDRQ